MSNHDHLSPADRPEYAPGDVLEVFNPHTNAYQWIAVESVLMVHGNQILVAHGSFYCACWVRTESLATPVWKVTRRCCTNKEEES